MTYKYIDSNTKKDENVLSVDFAFSGDTTMEDAIEQIDTLVLNINNDGDIDFTYHQPRMYSISHLSSILD